MKQDCQKSIKVYRNKAVKSCLKKKRAEKNYGHEINKNQGQLTAARKLD